MKDYRRILEVSADATADQIKAQYKRLVRVYHPDRFTSEADKIYVEGKLKEITEAYHALLKAPDPFTMQQTEARFGILPQPVALPRNLQFGPLTRGARRTLLFQVENAGGMAGAVQIRYSEEDSWFTVVKGRQLYNYKPFPMEFAVQADTSRLEIGKTYNGWLEIQIDDATARVALSTQVVRRRSPRLLTSRLMLIFTMVVVIGLLFSLQFFDEQLAHLLSNGQSSGQAGQGSGSVAMNSAATVATLPPTHEINAMALVSATRQTPTVTLQPLVTTANSGLSQKIALTPTATLSVTALVAPLSTMPAAPTARETLSMTAALRSALITLTAIHTATTVAQMSATLPPVQEITSPLAIATATVMATVAPTPSPVKTATIRPTVTITPQPTATATSTHTAIPESTVTPTKTRTPIPTSTATATPAPLPTLILTSTAIAPGAETPWPTVPITLLITVPNTFDVNTRADVSVQAALIQVLPKGSQWRAIGRTIDNTWLLLQIDNERVAWVLIEPILVDKALVPTLPIVIPPSYQNN